MHDDQKRLAIELSAQGKGATEIARNLGVTRSVVWHFLKNHSGVPQEATTLKFDPEAVKDMQIASLKRQLAQAMNSERVVMEPAYRPDESIISPEAKWGRAEAENAERIQKALLASKFSCQLPAEPVVITFVSDQHISIGNCVDLRRMREDAELIADTDGVYAVLGGDSIDNHIKHRAAVMAARSQPHDQYELFEWYLGIFAHRVLAVISGNHDAWTDQIAGVDVIGRICAGKKLCYAPDEVVVRIGVGDTTYSVGMRHQYRMNSTFNETHAVKQWWRLGQGDWDIGCIGHNHVSAVEPFWGHDKELWACRTGSYQITSAYSRQYGWNPTRPACPSFVLYPDRREIVGFHDLRPALRMLRAERGGR